MNPTLRKNLPIIIAFALPFLLIVIVTLAALLPRLGVHSAYNFVYATCDSGTYVYDCSRYLPQMFTVQNDALTVQEVPPNEDNRNVPTLARVNLYVHNTDTNESRAISTEYAQSLQYHGLKTSPDGYNVTRGDYNRIDVFPFYSSRSYNNWYLQKSSARKQMDVITGDYYSNFYLIGWIPTN